MEKCSDLSPPASPHQRRGRPAHAIRHQRQLRLRHVAVDPHHAVAAHDRIHRIGLAGERLAVRARDLRAREEVPAALAARMTVDHTDRPRPPGVLARLVRDDPRRSRVPGLHVRRRDPPHHDGAATGLADHAAHELGGIRAILERSEEHTSELQSLAYLVCRLLLEKKKKYNNITTLLTYQIT